MNPNPSPTRSIPTVAHRLAHGLRSALRGEATGHVCVWRDLDAGASIHWVAADTHEDLYLTAPTFAFTWPAARGLAAALASPEWTEFVSVHGQD